MKISDLEKALENSWAKETSVDPNNWKNENPAWGQCVPSSLIVNDYLGGKIVWALAIIPEGNEISHYFNEINGEEIDLTRKQFPEGTKIPKGISRTKQFLSTREYLLSSDAVKSRYMVLKERVQNYLSSLAES